ncbi:DoxX family protein [Flavobacteriaceae bacterium]|jgi:uncharacterized membrane protein|nr:DoxX family protein [Flavobacteriaceae bacterium]MBT5092487.1 DoxX family protein [Flavobacteriaceae bacterium]MBT5283143.1 DoxX family protein [Flavobacteriaceae bacterium]MBT5446935.1 DoxX family protein [Flavobacteriaceae bacterium]MBT5694243.1 DoxX family protein [Flavobacteriaceae bacterium]|tara:strand:+ start:3383 stop:3751 length:369 start_codon:yes stop_codon:yes gene_type:complete
MNLKKGMRYVMAILFPLVGITHFTNSSFFLVIVPPALPWHTSLVYISGFFEILFGIGLLTKYRKQAAYGLILLLIAVFPANIYLAISPIAQAALETSQSIAIVRLPFQFLFIWMAYSQTKNT